jgi:hypothetical protein
MHVDQAGQQGRAGQIDGLGAGGNGHLALLPTAVMRPSVTITIVTGRVTRSVTQVTNVEIQKVLPGISPLKAIQTLPGVTFMTADPWGNNEQNISLFIHGFNAQQLGYTLDGIPLGDQTYGNYQRPVAAARDHLRKCRPGNAGVGRGRPRHRIDQQSRRHHRHLLERPARGNGPRSRRRSAAIRPIAPMAASIPAPSAAATASPSRVCATRRRRGISTASRAAIRQTPSSFMTTPPAS